MSDPDGQQGELPRIPAAVPSVILGRTGLRISRLALGAGPVSGLMTGDQADLQRAVIQAMDAYAINWIDTAPGYGNGRSESQLGQRLAERPEQFAAPLHIATKVRIDINCSDSFSAQVHRSVISSLERLHVSRVTLLQLHNGITCRRGEEPASVALEDLTGPDGILAALCQVRNQGLTEFIGLTGTGAAEPLRSAIRLGEFDTLQVPYNLANPSAGQIVGEDFTDRNYGNVLNDCQRLNMGVFAIRVFAGGALLNQPPAAHTLTTPYFPLSLYHKDLQRAEQIQLATRRKSLHQAAIQFALAHPAVHCAIIGFATPEHVAAAAAAIQSEAGLMKGAAREAPSPLSGVAPINELKSNRVDATPDGGEGEQRNSRTT